MKHLCIAFYIFLFVLVGFGQGKDSKEIPDLSGTWILDPAKSGPESGYSIGPSKLDIALTILHKNPELKVNQTTKGMDGKSRTVQYVYYSDGRKTALRGKNDDENFRKVFWKGKKLIKLDQYVLSMGEGMDWFLEKNNAKSVKMETREEIEISKDGNTLTQKLFGGTAPGVPPSGGYRYVFRRQT